VVLQAQTPANPGFGVVAPLAIANWGKPVKLSDFPTALSDDYDTELVRRWSHGEVECHIVGIRENNITLDLG
jgi:hypothetical protein